MKFLFSSFCLVALYAFASCADPVCELGTWVKKHIKCGKGTTTPMARDGPFAECYGGLEQLLSQTTKLDTWCQWKQELCCQHDDAGFCPDKQVPWFHEPLCEGWVANKPNSGMCLLRNGSMCQNGHCCSKGKFDGNGKYEKPEYSYITNQPCRPGTRPKPFPAGYCDPKSEFVVIIGKLSPDGRPLVHSPLNPPKQCHTDAECSADHSTLCLYETSEENSEAHCYANPLIKPSSKAESKDDDNMMIIVILLVVLLVVLLLALILGFVAFKVQMKKKKDKKARKRRERKGRRGRTLAAQQQHLPANRRELPEKQKPLREDTLQRYIKKKKKKGRSFL